MKLRAAVSLMIACLTLTKVSGPSHAKAASPDATLEAVAVSAPPFDNELVLRIEGEYTFRAIQATDETVFVDLKGVKAGRVPKSGQWPGRLVTGYRLLEYTGPAGQSVVRVQVEIKHHEPFRLDRDGTALRLLFGQNPPANPDFAVSEQRNSGLRARGPGDLAVQIPSPKSLAPNPQSVTGTPPVISSSGLLQVTGISIQAGANGKTFVDVWTTRSPVYRVLQLKNPARLVVDFEEARNAAHQRTYPAQSPVLKQVRVAQFREKGPAMVRVVADLAGDPTFDVHAQPGGVRIDLK